MTLMGTKVIKEKRYWVCHTRGPDFNRLRKLGFKTFYPTLDDYVFLEVKPENEPLLRKQTDLCVAFVKNKKGYITVSEAEVSLINEGTSERMEVGSYILAVDGAGANLEGEILDERGEEVFVRLKGYNREYEIWTDRHHIVPLEEKFNDRTSAVDC